MSTDLRDPEVREALDRAVRHLEPDPEARLETVLRRGGLLRSLRLGAVGVVVAFLVAGVGWGAIEIQRQRSATPLDTARWETYRDRELGWSMAYPPGWQVQTFHDEFLATFRGALVSNVDFEFRHPDLGEGRHTSAWDMRGLPPHAVVVQFQAMERFGLPTQPPAALFPLSLDNAQRVRDRPPYGAPQPRLFLPLDETGYAVFAWFGPDTSARDRAIAEGIVASIKFVGSDATEDSGCLDQVAPATPTKDSDVLWRFRLQDWNVTAPVLVGDSVYVGSNGPLQQDGCLYALDAATGGVLWVRPPGIDAYTVPVPTGSTLLVALGGSIQGLDQETGEELWSVPVGTVDPEGIVVTDAGMVFVTGISVLAAVDARTGEVTWEVTQDQLPVLGPIVVEGDTLYTSSFRNRYPLKLHALDAITGERRWTVPALGVPVAAGGGVVLVEQAPNTLHAHDAATGEERWVLNVPGSETTGPVILGDLAVLATDDGSALGIEIATGHVRWRGLVGVFGAPLVVGEQLVFVGTAQGVYALEPSDGSVAWSFQAGALVESLEFREEGLIAGAGGRIFGVDPDSGSVQWEAEAGGRVNRTPSFGEGVVYVRDGTSDVVAVRVPSEGSD